MDENELTKRVMADVERVMKGLPFSQADKEFYLCGVDHGISMTIYHLRKEKERVA